MLTNPIVKATPRLVASATIGVMSMFDTVPSLEPLIVTPIAKAYS